jgi:hypothetical protein
LWFTSGIGTRFALSFFGKQVFDPAQGQGMEAMNATTFAFPEHLEARIERDLERGLLRGLEGTLQRVDYKGRVLTVIAQCNVWHFKLDSTCQLWFDDRPGILRCFHPLDQVKVIYAETEDGGTVKAMYAWERK